MRNMAGLKRIDKRIFDMILTYEVVKIIRTIFAVKCNLLHDKFLKGSNTNTTVGCRKVYFVLRIFAFIFFSNISGEKFLECLRIVWGL